MRRHWLGVAGSAAVFLFTSCGENAGNIVVAPTVAAVVLAPATASVAVGATVQLTATPEDSNGNPVAGATVSWASLNPNVATVNSSGLVQGVAAGTATIRATSSGKTADAILSVTAATAALAAPTGLSAVAASSTSINLSWNTVAGAAGYAVYRDSARVIDVTATSHTDTGLQPATSYPYTVRAFDAANTLGAPSTAVSATTLSTTSGGCEATAGRCFYLSLTGTTSGSGSLTQPFATYAQAHAVLRVGDVLYYRGGIYTNPAQFIEYATALNGASGQRITIKPYPGEHVVFDNQGNCCSVAYLGGEGAIVEGFEFRNSHAFGPTPAGFLDYWTPGVAVWGNHHTFRRNWVHHITGGPTGNGGSLRVQHGTNLHIHNNAFTNLYVPNEPGHPGNVNHIQMFGGGNQRIHTNYFSHDEDKSQNAVYQKHPAEVGTSEIYNNTFENISGMGVQIVGSRYSVHHNLFINSRAGNSLSTNDNVTWEYNTFYGNLMSPFHYVGYPLKFASNIIHHTGTYDAGSGSYILRINHYGDDAAYSTAIANDVFENNCYHNPNLPFQLSYFGGSPTSTGGVYTLAQFKALGKDAGSVEADPQFTDVAGRDFRPRSTSPCVAMGAYAGGTYSPPMSPAAARGW